MSGDHASFIGIIAGALCCTNAFVCNLAFDQYGGIILWVLVMLYMFKALGVICDEYFVPSLEVIVDKLQLSNDVAGATFMAAGSSAPELFTSLVATFLIVNEGGVGTIVGSAIFNILVIVGATGFIACKEQSLKIWWYPLSRDSFFYCVAIMELMIVISNESVEWYECLIMILTYCLYIFYMWLNPTIVKMLGLTDPSEDKVSTVEEVNVKGSQVAPEPMETMNGTTTALRTIAGDNVEDLTKQPPEVGGSGMAAPGTVEEVESATTKLHQSSSMNTVDKTSSQQTAVPESTPVTHLEAPGEHKEKRRPSWSNAEMKHQEQAEHLRQSQAVGGHASDGGAKPGDGATEDDKPLTMALPEGRSGLRSWLRDPLVVLWEVTMPHPERCGGSALFAASIFFIGTSTYMMVDATNRVGVILHIPPLAMALVFLAAGTSIPDALGSIAVAKQGEGDMAVSNALGSNIFDILIGLGVPWLIKTGFMQKKVEFIGKWDELVYDIVVLLFVLLLFIGCLIAHKWYLTRKVGILLLIMYGVFLIYMFCAIWVFDPPLKTQEVQADCRVI